MVDNGSGFDIARAFARNRGLVGLSSRAEQAAGILRASSQPGETRIQYVVANTHTTRSTPASPPN